MVPGVILNFATGFSVAKTCNVFVLSLQGLVTLNETVNLFPGNPHEDLVNVCDMDVGKLDCVNDWFVEPSFTENT